MLAAHSFCESTSKNRGWRYGEACGELPLAVKNQSMEQKMGPLKLDFTQKSVSYQQLGPGMASMATGKHGDFEDIAGGGGRAAESSRAHHCGGADRGAGGPRKMLGTLRQFFHSREPTNKVPKPHIPCFPLEAPKASLPPPAARIPMLVLEEQSPLFSSVPDCLLDATQNPPRSLSRLHLVLPPCPWPI